MNRSEAASVWRIPAITDFRAKGTIIGLAGLTAVFGMGTGVAPPVWSPEKWPAGGQASPVTVGSVGSCSKSDTPVISEGASGGTSTTLSAVESVT